LTEIEWRISPLLEDWADVATFDAPGAGGEPAPTNVSLRAVSERGLEQIDNRGWRRCVIAGDEYGAYSAIHLAAAHPERVAGLALGHACLSFALDGPRAPMNADVMTAFVNLADVDYRTYVRHLTQLTQDAYDDELADEYLERVPQATTLAYLSELAQVSSEDLEPLLRNLGRPLLLAKHDGCLGWTDEGFEDAVAALPGTMAISMKVKPSASPEFAEALRDFCESLEWK
jgi:pimeloyl-ACP methyl ester carboxylesterase